MEQGGERKAGRVWSREKNEKLDERLGRGKLKKNKVSVSKEKKTRKKQRSL